MLHGAIDQAGSNPPRPTIADVARTAGVSVAVVSYALNGKPGVSPATRERVLRAADDLGWRPSAAARSVRGGTRSVGLAVSTEPGCMARSSYFLDFIAATDQVLLAAGLTLSLQVERAGIPGEVYRTWWAERRFEVFIVPDLLTDDPRVGVLRRIHAPAVVLSPYGGGEGLASVSMDEADAGARTVAYLAELGHVAVAVVTGPTRIHRTLVRLGAFAAAADDRGCRVIHRETDGTAAEAAAATNALLSGPEPPTAIAYDTDTMAVAGLAVAHRSGVEVPWGVSIVAGTDSELTRLATPAITALPASAVELGAATGRAVLEVLGGQVDVRVVLPVGGLAVRGTTGPPAV
jgi:DNA-binding LacI/PurR family transcriptional regulator